MTIDRYEVALIFLTHNYKELISGKKVPPIKFVFKEDGYKIFETLLKLSRDKFTDRKVYQYHIDLIKGGNYGKKVDNLEEKQEEQEDTSMVQELVIYVPDALEFFSSLAIIANLYYRISRYPTPSKLAEDFFSCALWLRMTPQDCLDITGFLNRQIDYLYNICYLDDIEEIEFGKYTIAGLNDVNDDFYEAYNKMNLQIYDKEDGESLYELPTIHYGIVDENYSKVCYIYGIQNMSLIDQDEGIKTAIKKNIKRSGITPSFILAMKTFIDILFSKDIKEIRVPLLEVLNYDYHVKFSEDYKKMFEIEWPEEKIEELNNGDDQSKIIHYSIDKRIHDNYVDKADNISKSKSETLAYVISKVQEQFDGIDIEVLDFELRIKPKKHKLLEKVN